MWEREQDSPAGARRPAHGCPPRGRRTHSQAGAAVDAHSFPASPQVTFQLGPCVPTDRKPPADCSRLQTCPRRSDGCRGHLQTAPRTAGRPQLARPRGTARASQTPCANRTRFTHLALRGAAPWGVGRRGFCGAGVPPPLPTVTVHSPSSASISLQNTGGVGPAPKKSREGAGRAETTASARQRHGSCSVPREPRGHQHPAGAKPSTQRPALPQGRAPWPLPLRGLRSPASP